MRHDHDALVFLRRDMLEDGDVTRKDARPGNRAARKFAEVIVDVERRVQGRTQPWGIARQQSPGRGEGERGGTGGDHEIFEPVLR